MDRRGWELYSGRFVMRSDAEKDSIWAAYGDHKPTKRWKGAKKKAK